MKVKLLQKIVVVLALFSFCTLAWAAQDSTVIGERAVIRKDPKKTAKALEFLPVGIEVRVSSYPMSGGWYKIRSKTGEYGWIHESDLSVNKPDAPSKRQKDRKELPKPERDRIFFARGFGGISFFRPDDLNAIFQFNELNTGYHVGGEFGAFISSIVALVFRFEALAKNTVAREVSSNTMYNLGLRSYPVMLGVDFHFLKAPALRISTGIFGGVGLATSLSAEALNSNPPNIYVLEKDPLTTLVRVNVTRPLGRVFSIFAEAGYRYLRTEKMPTSDAEAVNGGRVFLRGTEYKERYIDLSGFLLSGGFGVHF